MTRAQTVSGLEFEPITHTYRLDGVVIPSVTQILEATGISDYSMIPNATRNMALKRGSLVHEAIQFDIEGDLDWETLDPVLVPYVEAARHFRADYGLGGGFVEFRGYNPKWRFAGTLDYRPGDLLVDWKCGGAAPWVRTQTAAYASFFPEPRKYRRIAVGLFPDGHYDATQEQRCADWAQDFNDFLCLARTRYLQTTGGAL